MVSLALSTLDSAEEFEEKLRELEELIPLIVFRTYITNEEKPEGISSETLQKMEELKALRTKGILGEMNHILAQAKARNLQLNDDIISGKSIAPSFRKEVLDAIPSLKVYEYFAPYTLKELEKLANLEEKKSPPSVDEPDDGDGR